MIEALAVGVTVALLVAVVTIAILVHKAMRMPDRLLEVGELYISARASADRATRELGVRVEEVKQRDETIKRLEAVIAEKSDRLRRHVEDEVAELSDADLRARANRVHPHGGAARSGGGAGIDTASGEITVSDVPATGAPR